MGALFPALVGFPSDKLGLGSAILLFAIIGYGLMPAKPRKPCVVGRSLDDRPSAVAFVWPIDYGGDFRATGAWMDKPSGSADTRSRAPGHHFIKEVP